jgi:hypothetical protein
MKKTAQIVTVPLNKEGWSKDELLKHIIKDTTQYSQVGDYKLINGGNSLNAKCWQPQQLLVLSDDEIQVGDIITDKYKVWKWNDDCSLLGRKKVIASYPQLEGTLPISKETVQAWIDAGTPEECGVDKHEWSTVLNDSITIKHLVKNNWKLVKSELPKPPFDDALMYYYERNTLDPQGNLLLEFPEQQTIEDIRSGYLSVEWIKPSIPTDEKINDIASDYAVEKCRIMKNMKCLTARKTAYIDGYRQALKDLGHE